jgi:hypothetical protein
VIGELDSTRLGEFRQALLGQNVSEDEAVETFWKAEYARREREDREDRRREWVAHYRRLALVFTHIAEEHEQRAAALEEGR